MTRYVHFSGDTDDPMDWSEPAIRRDGMNYLCTIPRPLGRVTKLEFIHGKLVARTESGMTFICPTSKIFGNDS
jgi:hypothetical protein